MKGKSSTAGRRFVFEKNFENLNGLTCWQCRSGCQKFASEDRPKFRAHITKISHFGDQFAQNLSLIVKLSLIYRSTLIILYISSPQVHRRKRISNLTSNGFEITKSISTVRFGQITVGRASAGVALLNKDNALFFSLWMRTRGFGLATTSQGEE